MAGLLDLSTLDPNFMASMLGGQPSQGAPAPTGAPPSAAPAGALAGQGIAAPAIATPAAAPQTSILDGLFAPKAPHVATNADRLNLIGATLRDVGASLRGKDSTAIKDTEAAIQAEGPSGAQKAVAAAQKGVKTAAQPTDTSLMYAVGKNLFPGDPKAQFLFATGNQDFLKQISDSGYGFHTVTGGDTYGTPAGGMHVAPKLDRDGNQFYTQGADGVTNTGAGPLSAEEQTGQQNAATEAAKAAELARHNKIGEGIDQQKVGIEGGQLGVAQKHLGIDQSNSVLEHLKFGHESNPTAPVVYTPDDYAKLPSGQHLQYVAPDGSLRIKP